MLNSPRLSLSGRNPARSTGKGVVVSCSQFCMQIVYFVTILLQFCMQIVLILYTHCKLNCQFCIQFAYFVHILFTKLIQNWYISSNWYVFIWAGVFTGWSRVFARRNETWRHERESCPASSQLWTWKTCGGTAPEKCMDSSSRKPHSWQVTTCPCKFYSMEDSEGWRYSSCLVDAPDGRQLGTG